MALCNVISWVERNTCWKVKSTFKCMSFRTRFGTRFLLSKWLKHTRSQSLERIHDCLTISREDNGWRRKWMKKIESCNIEGRKVSFLKWFDTCNFFISLIWKLRESSRNNWMYSIVINKLILTKQDDAYFLNSK